MDTLELCGDILHCRGQLNPIPAGGGLIGPPFWKTQFTQNFTLVSDYSIDLLFTWMPYAPFDTFFGILPHMGHALGAPKVKKM